MKNIYGDGGDFWGKMGNVWNQERIFWEVGKVIDDMGIGWEYAEILGD